MLKSFVKQIINYLPSRLLPALTALVTTPILTHLLLPVEYGYWALALGVTDFLIALACLGFGSAIIRFFPAYKADSKLDVFFSTLSIFITLIIIVVSVFSLIALLLFKRYLSTGLYPILLLSVPIFIVQGFFTIFMTVVRAQERSNLYTIFSLFSYYGGLGVGLFLITFVDLGVEGLLIGTLLTFILALPLLISSTIKGVKIRFHLFRFPDAVEMWHYAWPLVIGNISLWALRLSDRYIINHYGSIKEVGLYSVAYNISGRSIDMLVALFLLSIYPMMMNTWENKGRLATEKLLTLITRLYLLVCLPAAVGLGVLSFPLVDLLTADSYQSGYRIVGYVAFSSFFMGLSQIAQMGIVIKKKARRVGGNEVVAALVNIVLNFVLVPHIGFIAAGINILVSYVILFGLHTCASRPYLKWRLPIYTFRNVIIATIIMGLTAFAIYPTSNYGDRVHLGNLILSIAISVFVYLASLWLLGEVTEEEKSAARKLWQNWERR
jgi:O-antigen/teichoic acid export membrane protein